MAVIYDKAGLADIGELEQNFTAASTLDQLSSMINLGSEQFGFGWFALVHNVDLARRSKGALLLTNYPAIWVKEIIDERLYLDGPVHAACSKSTTGLTWDRIDEFIVPSPRQLSTLDRARDHGLRSGFTMPIRIDGEPDAMFSLARRCDNEFSPQDIMTARLIGTAAFDRARSILGGDCIAYKPIALSPRQIDCVALVAQGKSDWEIAQILALGQNTVHEYVEAARKRYGVRRRTQLVLRAVRDGHLNIDELI
jgi:DNA-binding CsgD family transcriptional regulator